ncbi:MAG TPA: TIR domain-containing protein [Waterburya sp.]|jgi:hypothetical protein
MANETFLSYSRKDYSFVGLLYKALQQAGINIWIDWEDIAPSSLWRQEICVAIQASKNFVFIISPDSVESEECLKELNHALLLNKRLIPVVSRQVEFSKIPPALREINWIFFTRDFDTALNQLLAVIDAPLGVGFERVNNKIILFSGDTEREFILERNYYLIGRNPPGKIQEFGLIFVTDSYMSRCHASLLKRDGQWHIADGFFYESSGQFISYKESKNGLKIKHDKNSRPLTRHCWVPLANGDEIVLSPVSRLIYRELHTQPQPVEPDDRETVT